MKERKWFALGWGDETTRGLALLLACALLAAGIVEFAGEQPSSSSLRPAVFVYRNVEVLAPRLSVRGRVNVNTAGIADLVRLRGIGETLAGRIIAFREANGPFACLDDLAGVQGIGPSTIDGFRDEACVVDEQDGIP